MSTKGYKKENAFQRVIIIGILSISLIGSVVYFYNKQDDRLIAKNSLSNQFLEKKYSEKKLVNLDVRDILSVDNDVMLKEIFGEENLENNEASELNDNSKSYILFPNSNKKLLIDFDENSTSITMVMKNSPWVTPFGLRLHMSIYELLSINEKPIDFYGFGWELGGAVANWNGGKLENKGIMISLSTNATGTLLNKFSGDGLYSSTDTSVQDLNLRIETLKFIAFK